jgi:ubiquitin-activating enzyme E1
VELTSRQLQRALTSEEAKLVACFAKGFVGQLSPMAAIMGALAAHEVTKAASGKFTPTSQWMYLDSVEALPSPLPAREECAPQGCRYDGQVAVFGRSLQQRVQHSKTFLVGAGAIGCEMLKNL